VPAISTQVQSKVQKIKEYKAGKEDETDPLETKTKEVGSARRNIQRKKSGVAEGKYDNRNKKQGGHGKGQWKLDGSILDDYAGEALNEDDPIYDETVQAKYILSSGEMTETPVALQNGKAIYGPLLTLPEFKIRLTETFREYFDSADSDEVIRSIEEMKCRAYYPEVVKKAVSLSLDEGPRERELVSRLLTCLHPTPLSDQDMEIGFELLLDGLDELVIDCPDAHVSFPIKSKYLLSILSFHIAFVSNHIVNGWMFLGTCCCG
jgi:MA3 domain